MPVLAFSPELKEQNAALMESRYAFWFQGDRFKALNAFDRADVRRAEVAWHGADLLISQNKKEEALNLLLEALPYSYGEEAQSLSKRIFSKKPHYRFPFIEENQVYIPYSYVKEHGKRLWTIKRGIPLMIQQNPQGQVVSLRIHQIKNAGHVASNLGFSVGDRIFSLNEKSVADWSKLEVLPFFLKAATVGSIIKIEIIPNNEYRKIEKVFHIVTDSTVIKMNVENEKRSK